jgi:hypothetical protein
MASAWWKDKWVIVLRSLFGFHWKHMAWVMQADMGYANLTLVWQNSTMGSSDEDLWAMLFTPV